MDERTRPGYPHNVDQPVEIVCNFPKCAVSALLTHTRLWFHLPTGHAIVYALLHPVHAVIEISDQLAFFNAAWLQWLSSRLWKRRAMLRRRRRRRRWRRQTPSILHTGKTSRGGHFRSVGRCSASHLRSGGGPSLRPFGRPAMYAWSICHQPQHEQGKWGQEPAGYDGHFTTTRAAVRNVLRDKIHCYDEGDRSV